MIVLASGAKLSASDPGDRLSRLEAAASTPLDLVLLAEAPSDRPVATLAICGPCG